MEINVLSSTVRLASMVVNIEVDRYGARVDLPFLHRAAPLTHAPLAGDDAAELAKLLHALANEQRLTIVSVLLHHPARAMNGGEIQAALGLSQPTTSHHLARLVRAGLLDRERDGSFVRYRVAPEAFARLRRVFAEG
jgi:ArsR family transcriptional regulator